MLTNGAVPLALGGLGWRITDATMAQHPYIALTLVAVAVLALTLVAAGFLFLVWRISWGVQQFVATCRQRAKLEARITEVLRDYIDGKHLTQDQVWEAAGALSPC